MKKGRNLFAVLGLGRFGQSVAETLAKNIKCSVLVMDSNEIKIKEISKKVEAAVVGDVTKQEDLKAAGLSEDFDAVIVAIGSNIESSIMTTLALKEMGINRIIAKARTEDHAKILRKLGAARVVIPEKELGERIANDILNKKTLEYMEINDEFRVEEIEILSEWEGHSLKDLNFRQVYNLNLIAIKRNNQVDASIDADSKFIKGDRAIVAGANEKIDKIKEKKKYE